MNNKLYKLNDRETPIPAGYVSIKVLAEKYGYAVNHVAWLARTERVDAIQRGSKGQWLVSPASMEKYRRLLSIAPVAAIPDGYMPLVDLALKYGYAKNYLAQLAKSGKIEAVQDNKGFWFAHDKSTEKYIQDSAAKWVQPKPNDASNLLTPPDRQSNATAPAPSEPNVLSNESSSNAEGRPRINTALALSALVGGVLILAFGYFFWTGAITGGRVVSFLNTLEDGFLQIFNREAGTPETLVIVPRPSASPESIPSPSPSSSPVSTPNPASPSPKPTIINNITVVGATPADLTRIKNELAGENLLSISSLQSAIADLNNRLSNLQSQPANQGSISSLQTALALLTNQVNNLSSLTARVWQGPVDPTAQFPNAVIFSKADFTGPVSIAQDLTVTGNFSSNGFRAVNGQVGIGTSNLTTALEVVGTASVSQDLRVGNNLFVGNTLSVGGASSFGNQFAITGSASISGTLSLTKSPTLAHTGTWPIFANTENATLYINAASPVADGNIITYANNGSPKFVVDAEGDVYANNVVLTGTTTTGTTSVAGDFTVEGNTRFGDASTDKIRLVGTIVPLALSTVAFTIQASASQTADLFQIKNSAGSNLYRFDPLGNASQSGNFELGGTASVGGNVTIRGTLGVTGNTTLSTLGVTGTTTLTGAFIGSNTGSNSFAGSLDVAKGLRAANFTQVGAGNNYFNGNVGIGTTAPARSLHIASLTDAYIRTQSNSGNTAAANSGWELYDGPNIRWGWINNSANDFKLNRYDASGVFQDQPFSAAGATGIVTINNELGRSGGVTRLNGTSNILGVAVDASGNVGIDTAVPLVPLHIDKAGTTTVAIGGVTVAAQSSNLQLRTGSGKTGFLIGAQYNLDNAFEITPSTAAGGTTFTTPAFTILSNSNVGVGTSAPGSLFTVDKSAIAATSTDGITIQNITAATAGVPVQQSPRLRFRSNVWNTTATAATNTDDFWIESAPVSGTTPSGLLKVISSLNGAAGVQVLSIASAGTLTVAGSVVAGSGQALRWTSRSILTSPATGQMNLTNSASTAGVGFDVTTDAVLKIRTTAQSGDASLTALNLTASGVVLTGDGTAAAPAFAFASAPTQGFYKQSGNIYVSQTNTFGLGFQTTTGILMSTSGGSQGIFQGSAGKIAWTSNHEQNAADTMISRSSAGVLQIGTTTNNALGSLLLTNLTTSGNLLVTGTITHGAASVSGNFDPSIDNTYSLGNTAFRWKDISVGPGSFKLSSTTGTAGTGANYTLGQIAFASGSSLSFGTSAVGTGNVGTLALQTAGTPRMFIGSTGNVGIGTTGPHTPLEVNGQAVFGSTSGGVYISPNASAGLSEIYGLNTTATTYNNLGLRAGAATQLYLNTNGNVGIGATAPLSKLSIVSSDNLATTDIVKFTFDASNNYRSGIAVKFVDSNAPANLMNFNVSNGTTTGQTTVMSLQGNGYVGMGTSPANSKLDIKLLDVPVTANPNAGNVMISTTDAQAINKGGSIGLGGSYTDGGLQWVWGVMHAGKENSTTGNSAGYLRFLTNATGGNLAEHMRIDSIGVVTFNNNVQQVTDVAANLGTAAIRWAGTHSLNFFGAYNAGPDTAERYPASEPVEAGDVVMLDPTPPANKTVSDQSNTQATDAQGGEEARTGNDVPLAIKKANGFGTLLGIVSTRPGVTMSDPYDHTNPPVALVGRIPTKVSNENGPIHTGDRLTVSKTQAGIAMKQTEPGPSIGIALEDTSDSGKILAFVNLSYWVPSTAMLSADASLDETTLLKTNEGGRFTLAALFQFITGQFEKVLHTTFGNGTIETGSVTVHQGVTIYDQDTGNPFCIGIKNGQTVTTPGACSVITPTATPSPFSTPQPSPEASAGEATPTPEASVTPTPSPEPTQNPSPTPEPTSEPTNTPTPAPEPTQTPSPTESPAPTPEITP